MGVSIIIPTAAIALFRITAADGRKGEFQFQFRHLFGDPSGEGIAVGTGESLVGRFPWVSMGGFVNGSNQFVDPRSPSLHESPGFLAIPVAVGNVLCDP